MTRDERLALERLYNLVQPSRLVVDPRHDQGWQAIAIFEEEIKGTEEEVGLRVQCATVHPNDARLNALHPENEKQYHLAQLICAAVNALPELLREGMQR